LAGAAGFAGAAAAGFSAVGFFSPSGPPDGPVLAGWGWGGGGGTGDLTSSAMLGSVVTQAAQVSANFHF